MKILIIGGVAAGTKAAAKLKRENRDLDITIIAKDGDISYAGCGLPYYIGGFIKDRSSLIVNTPQKYAAMTGVSVLTNVEAIAVDNNNHTVIAKNLITNEEASYAYDKLIIATGASPITPPIEGVKKQGVFSLRLPNDAVNIRDYVTNNQVKKAVIVGGGFIGLEVAENLLAQKVDVTVIDFAPQIMPNVIDPEIASYVQKHLQKHGIRVLTGVAAQEVLGDDKVSALKTSAGELSADLVILSVGIRPNTAFLNDTGMEMFKGTILVNEQLQTNLPDIYAIGDCAMVSNRMTHSAQWSPMGSSANLEGRLLAQILNNLISNALKFTSKGHISIGYKTVGNKVQFTVSDTGIGIDQDSIDFIFDRFHKIENPETVFYRGAGLGLSICQTLVEMLGGEINVISTAGKGSSFQFTISTT